jgi:tRNA G46 methylase TrmB
LSNAIIDKFRTKLSEFLQADRKSSWMAEQFKWRYFTFLHKKQSRLNVVFDREHGIETAQELPLAAAGVAPEDVARGNGVYRPLTAKLFRAALASIAIDATKFTFVDIGSGKGKVLFMASDHPFKRIVGIEYAKGLHETALRNVAAYRSKRQKCKAIDPTHADALEYEFPHGPLVLFIFNALAKEIMRELLSKLDRGAAADRDRPIVLIYTNVRNVTEVRGVFSGLKNLRVIRGMRNFVVIANQAGAGVAA